MSFAKYLMKVTLIVFIIVTSIAVIWGAKLFRARQIAEAGRMRILLGNHLLGNPCARLEKWQKPRLSRLVRQYRPKY
jgi:hypothetical protein